MAELSNQLHINSLSERQAAFVDSFLQSIPTPSRRKQSHNNFPSLQIGVGAPIAALDVQHHHFIPGVIGDGDAVNQQLLQDDQLNTQGSQERCNSFFNKNIEQIRTVCAAARMILDQEISNNRISVKQFRWIVRSLRDHLKLRAAQPHMAIPHEEAYARILKCLAHRLITLTNHQSVALSYRPFGYVECLDKLLAAMEQGFMVMRQTGNEEDVYIVTDIGYSERLFSLASHLTLERQTVPEIHQKGVPWDLFETNKQT